MTAGRSKRVLPELPLIKPKLPKINPCVYTLPPLDLLIIDL